MKKLFLALGSLAVLVAAGVMLYAPRNGRAERSRFIAARPSLIVAQLNELERWTEWLPQEQLPRARRVFAGPRLGPGSSLYWYSKDDQGRMTIISVSEQRVQIERELTKPRKSTLDMIFDLTPDGAGTRVTVSVVGETDMLGNPRRAVSDAAKRLNAQLDDLLEPLAKAAEEQEKIEASRIEKTAVVAAAPATLVEHLAAIRNWQAWSPWPGSDPTARISYGGHDSGPGATVYWSTGKHAGRITIISAAADKVVAELGDDTPPTSSADLVFRLSPEGKGSKVTLSVTGPAADRDVEQALTRLSAVFKGSVNMASKGN